MSDKWIRRFLVLANIHSSFSKDPSRKIGCIITDSNNKVVSTGYNGLPKWMNDDCLKTLSKEDKCDLMIHAEINAIESIPPDKKHKDLIMYVNSVPCYKCSLKIKNSNYKIKNIYYTNIGSETYQIRHRIHESLDILKSAGIEPVLYELGEDVEEAIQQFIQTVRI